MVRKQTGRDMSGKLRICIELDLNHLGHYIHLFHRYREIIWPSQEEIRGDDMQVVVPVAILRVV